MSTAWSWKLVGDVCWDISQIKPVGSVVYKTHDYAEFLPSTSRNNLKVVFVYGDVVEAVASVANQAEERGEVWLRSHYEHLRSDAKGYEDLFENDALGIERQLLSWSSVQGVDVCLISMSGLWDYQRELGRFLGLNLRFPKPRPRSSGTKRIVGEKGDIILDRYSGAVGIIENLPDFFIRRA